MSGSPSPKKSRQESDEKDEQGTDEEDGRATTRNRVPTTNAADEANQPGPSTSDGPSSLQDDQHKMFLQVFATFLQEDSNRNQIRSEFLSKHAPSFSESSVPSDTPPPVRTKERPRTKPRGPPQPGRIAEGPAFRPIIPLPWKTEEPAAHPVSQAPPAASQLFAGPPRNMPSTSTQYPGILQENYLTRGEMSLDPLERPYLPSPHPFHEQLAAFASAIGTEFARSIVERGLSQGARQGILRPDSNETEQAQSPELNLTEIDPFLVLPDYDPNVPMTTEQWAVRAQQIIQMFLPNPPPNPSSNEPLSTSSQSPALEHPILPAFLARAGELYADVYVENVRERMQSGESAQAGPSSTPSNHEEGGQDQEEGEGSPDQEACGGEGSQ